MIIALGTSKQEDFHRPEKPLEKTPEIDSEVRISKKAEMKRKFNRNQNRIIPWNIQLSSLTFLVLITLKINWNEIVAKTAKDLPLKSNKGHKNTPSKRARIQWDSRKKEPTATAKNLNHGMEPTDGLRKKLGGTLSLFYEILYY